MRDQAFEWYFYDVFVVLRRHAVNSSLNVASTWNQPKIQLCLFTRICLRRENSQTISKSEALQNKIPLDGKKNYFTRNIWSLISQVFPHAGISINICMQLIIMILN